MLPINQNEALFALLGTKYGGNGQTTFALPTMKPIFTATGAPLLTLYRAVRGISVAKLSAAARKTGPSHRFPLRHRRFDRVAMDSRAAL